MKKKKVIITSIIATLLLAGLLFYWNNNEVHACEAVSLEEAREILTEENLLLEYSNYNYPRTQWTEYSSRKSFWEIAWYENELSKILICRDGAVYYCSFHMGMNELPDTTLESIHNGWAKEPSYIYYLGKISTMELYKLVIRVELVDMEAETSGYTYEEEVNVPESVGGSEQKTEESIVVEESSIDKDTGYYARYNLWNCLSSECKIYRSEDGEAVELTIMKKGRDYSHFLIDLNAAIIRIRMEDSEFFERYAVMAYRELATGRNPVTDVTRQIDIENIVQYEENDIRILDNSASRCGVGCEGHFYYRWYYINRYVIYQISLENMNDERTPHIIFEGYASALFPQGENALGLSGEKYIVLDPEGAYVEYPMPDNVTTPKMVKVCGDTFYYSDYRSLVRINPDGEIELLWDTAVFCFEVDENYIYIFDGNTWYLLDRITGEYLGWFVTDVTFTYEMDDIFVCDGKLYFAARNLTENTISCNSLDMAGNMTLIGEVHPGSERDFRCITCYEQYLYYSICNGTEIVRVDLNTGEEERIILAEYDCYQVEEMVTFENKLMVYVRDNDNDYIYLKFDLETLEYEGILYP